MTRPPPFAALGAQIDDPVGARADHVEVVLDDEHAVARLDEALEHAEEALDVLEVQARRGLVEHVERAAGLHLRASSRESLMRCASPPETVVAGWPIFM
jgi:hypothetical protein